MKFDLQNPFEPRGDQPEAIKRLVSGHGTFSEQALLGVTGSGKTFTVANVIQQIQKPTLILSHNKTLAAQLYQEFQTFFPNNKVCYFVSYYDYYQPESYLPQTDTFIEKDTSVNEQIEQLRLEAATSLLHRDDVIVVSSVSCIYGFGQAEDFEGGSFVVKKGDSWKRQDLIRRLVDVQYERNDTELAPGRFRVRGDTVDIMQGFANSNVVRIEFFGDEIDSISEVHPTSMTTILTRDEVALYPARPFVVPAERIPGAIQSIREELEWRLPQLEPLEAHRLKQRTNYDLEMIEQLGYCKGIENYSRHFEHRTAGSAPFTLLDFFDYSTKKDWLLVVDESHVTMPQVRGMYEGDRARKQNLIDYGFRLPSAADNRPLKFDEFEKYLRNTIYVSATPAEYELGKSGQVVEQIIRPTGLIDPPIEIKPIKGQVDDLIEEVRTVRNKGYRTLVTTLTKRMAEDLTVYFLDNDIKVKYLHSDIETLERTKIINELRLGKFDVLIGVNLLREGLDIPEVALVAILDADKEGFLRNARSLIQTIGRAARNAESKVIMYADVMTRSIKEAIKETDRRRKKQVAYNKKHNITPKTIIKSLADEQVQIEPGEYGKELDIDTVLIDLEGQMQLAAEQLEFEKAINLRDKIESLKKQLRKLKQ